MQICEKDTVTDDYIEPNPNERCGQSGIHIEAIWGPSASGRQARRVRTIQRGQSNNLCLQGNKLTCLLFEDAKQQ